LVTADIEWTYTSVELKSSSRITARQEAIEEIAVAGTVAMTFIGSFRLRMFKTAGIQLVQKEIRKYTKPSLNSSFQRSVRAVCFFIKATKVAIRMTKSKPIVRK